MQVHPCTGESRPLTGADGKPLTRSTGAGRDPKAKGYGGITWAQSLERAHATFPKKRDGSFGGTEEELFERAERIFRGERPASKKSPYGLPFGGGTGGATTAATKPSAQPSAPALGSAAADSVASQRAAWDRAAAALRQQGKDPAGVIGARP